MGLCSSLVSLTSLKPGTGVRSVQGFENVINAVGGNISEDTFCE
jgi:hypothetical protein